MIININLNYVIVFLQIIILIGLYALYDEIIYIRDSIESSSNNLYNVSDEIKNQIQLLQADIMNELSNVLNK